MEKLMKENRMNLRRGSQGYCAGLYYQNNHPNLKLSIEVVEWETWRVHFGARTYIFHQTGPNPAFVLGKPHFWSPSGRFSYIAQDLEHMEIKA